MPDLQGFSRGIVKEKIADEGCQCGGKHGNVQMITTGMIRQHTINENADEGGPHIDEVQSVKTMSDHQDVRRKGGAVGVGAADGNNQRAGDTAKPRVKEGTCKTPKGKIIGNQLGGTGENIPKIIPKGVCAYARECQRNRGSHKKGEIEKDDKTFKGNAVFAQSFFSQMIWYVCLTHNEILSLNITTYHHITFFGELQ